MPIFNVNSSLTTAITPLAAAVRVAGAAVAGAVVAGPPGAVAAAATQYALVNFRRSQYVDGAGHMRQPETPMVFLVWSLAMGGFQAAVASGNIPLTIRDDDDTAAIITSAVSLLVLVGDEAFLRIVGRDHSPLFTAILQATLPVTSAISAAQLAGGDLQARLDTLHDALAAMAAGPAVSELLAAVDFHAVRQRIVETLTGRDDPISERLIGMLGDAPAVEAAVHAREIRRGGPANDDGGWAVADGELVHGGPSDRSDEGYGPSDLSGDDADEPAAV